jgi:gag-polypeptide of LTR copia-type
MTSFSSFKGDKLIGRSNYIEWKNNADLFLEINGYISYIDGTEAVPNKRLYYDIIITTKDGEKTSTYDTDPFTRELGARYADRISEFNRNNKRALGALKSIISNDNNDRFKDKTSAKDLYDGIIDTFSQTSLELIGRYFDKMVDTNYNSFNNMDEYTSNIQSSMIYLTKLNQTIGKPIVAWLILKGLPSQYDSYASRKYEELTEDINEIDVSKLVSDLISEEGRFNSNINLEANKTSFNNNQSYCKHCNKKGHIEDKCFIKYPELRNNYSNSNNKTKTFKKYYKSTNKPKVIYKKKQSTKAIMSALLEDNNIINNLNNININKVDTSTSLKLREDNSKSNSLK